MALEALRQLALLADNLPGTHILRKLLVLLQPVGPLWIVGESLDVNKAFELADGSLVDTIVSRKHHQLVESVVGDHRALVVVDLLQDRGTKSSNVAVHTENQAVTVEVDGLRELETLSVDREWLVCLAVADDVVDKSHNGGLRDLVRVEHERRGARVLAQLVVEGLGESHGGSLGDVEVDVDIVAKLQLEGRTEAKVEPVLLGQLEQVLVKDSLGDRLRLCVK